MDMVQREDKLVPTKLPGDYSGMKAVLSCSCGTFGCSAVRYHNLEKNACGEVLILTLTLHIMESNFSTVVMYSHICSEVLNQDCVLEHRQLS